MGQDRCPISRRPRQFERFVACLRRDGDEQLAQIARRYEPPAWRRFRLKLGISEGAAGSRQSEFSFPGVLETGQGQALVDDWLKRIWAERESLVFSVANPHPAIEPGAVIRLPSDPETRFLVTGLEDGLVRRVSPESPSSAAAVRRVAARSGSNAATGRSSKCATKSSRNSPAVRYRCAGSGARARARIACNAGGASSGMGRTAV